MVPCRAIPLALSGPHFVVPCAVYLWLLPLWGLIAQGGPKKTELVAEEIHEERKMETIILKDLPPPNGHYSHAVRHNDTLYVSRNPSGRPQSRIFAAGTVHQSI